MGHITGKPLVGKYKNLKRIRLGKYRLIYGEKPCVIYLYDIKPRETAYIREKPCPSNLHGPHLGWGSDQES